MIDDIRYWFIQMCLAEKNYAAAQRWSLNFVVVLRKGLEACWWQNVKSMTSVLRDHYNNEQGVKIHYENTKQNLTYLFCISKVCPHPEDCILLLLFFISVFKSIE